MKNYSLLFVAFSLILALGVLHFSAIVFYFYWTMWWFDTLMHFLGGLSLGVFLIWVFHVSGMFGQRAPNRRQAFLTSLVSIAIIGVGWEIFEYVAGISTAEQNYALDTATDLVADMAGALLASFLGMSAVFYKQREIQING